MLGYLETSNDFGALAARTLVADAAAKVAADATDTRVPPQASGHRFDDRDALTYMHGVLAELA